MFIKTKVRGLEGERKNDLGSYNSRRFNFKGTGGGGGGEEGGDGGGGQLFQLYQKNK